MSQTWRKDKTFTQGVNYLNGMMDCLLLLVRTQRFLGLKLLYMYIDIFVVVVGCRLT